MAQTQSSWPPVLRGLTVKKKKFQTKINLPSVRGRRLVLRPRWTSRAMLPLIYHCIITHDAWALGLGLVVSRADKILISALFADSLSEIPSPFPYFNMPKK